MTDWTEALFYIAFLGQILLISYYLPKKLLERMRTVIASFPPEEYPKLYPQSVERYKIGHTVFHWANRAILVLGFVLLFLILRVVDHSTFADDGFISEFWPTMYGAIQIIPFLVLELSELGQLRLMRAANSETRRRASLQRRGFFDLVSPKLFAAAIIALAGTILFDLYLHDFEFVWGTDVTQRTIWLLISNAFMVAVGAFSVLGRRKDPHQADADRVRYMRTSLKALLLVSIAISCFYASLAADEVFGLSFLDATLMSLYLQAVVLASWGAILHGMRLEDADFSVYRATT